MESNNTFKVGDRTYPLVPIDEMSFREARLLKTYTPETGSDLVQHLMAADPDAWLAVMVVSMRRTRGPSTPVELLEQELDGINFMQTVESFFTEEETDEPDPTPAPDDADGTPAEKTPDGSGPQA